MRGADEQTGALFSYLSRDAMVPQDHPLRVIRRLVNMALARLSAEFARLYSCMGRGSIAPEKLLRALLCRRSTRCGRSAI
jgi:transposase